mgnify:FL=1
MIPKLMQKNLPINFRIVPIITFIMIQMMIVCFYDLSLHIIIIIALIVSINITILIMGS